MDKKFKKFEPMSIDANNKIEELVKRGGTIVSENRNYVIIKRYESFAKIDQFGRVEWNPQTL